MRRLTMLLASLLCSANTFAGTAKTKSPENALFDRLIGTWDVRYEFIGKNGKAKSNRGQAHYSWILDGKALQETWTSDSESKELRPFGTTIDFYDPKRRRWTAVWIYPAQGMTMIMTGGETIGSFVLMGHDESGALQRWSTNMVQSGSIVIRAEISKDEGKMWRPLGESYLNQHRN